LKNNAGYDLKQLFIGTEGTLGIVTRAVLRLHPKLPAKSTALCAAPGFEAALALLCMLQAQLAGGLSAFEAMWASYFDHVIAEIDAIRSPFTEPHPMYLLVESEGRDENEDRARLERALGAALEAGIVTDAVVAQS